MVKHEPNEHVKSLLKKQPLLFGTLNWCALPRSEYLSLFPLQNTTEIKENTFAQVQLFLNLSQERGVVKNYFDSKEVSE